MFPERINRVVSCPITAPNRGQDALLESGGCPALMALVHKQVLSNKVVR